jgi:hypothetical protein
MEIIYGLVPHGGTDFPADVDPTPGPGRYVGYHQNIHGEQLVYIHEKDETPIVYHGDNNWQPEPATLPEMSRLGWHMGNLVLAEDEVAWVLGCLGASGVVKQPLTSLISNMMQQAAQAAAENPT